MQQPSKKLWRFMPLIILIALAVFLYRGLSLNPRELPTAFMNKPAPILNKVSEKMKNKVWLLNVWATWCQACQEDHPVMMDLAKQGINLVGLNYKDDRLKAKQWLGQYGDPYLEVIDDPNGQYGIDWGVYGAPETFLIDKTGVIRYKHVGILSQQVWQQTLKPMIDKLNS